MPVLTDAKIKRAPRKEKPYQLTDGRGLYIIINPDGSNWWRLRYTVAGRRNILSLGVYPDTPLAAAREKCDAARKLIAQGIDPSGQRKAEKTAVAESAANRFEVVAREWLDVKAHQWSKAHLDKETLRLTKHAFPWIGGRPMMEIGVDDYLPVIKRVFDAGHLENAHRLREQLSRISRYAIATNRAKVDPAHALSEVLPSRRQGGFPAVVQPNEIRELLLAMDGFTGTFVVGCALRLAPYIFCRPGELRAMEWAHIHDLDGECPEIRVPPESRKLLRVVKESKRSEEGYQPLIIPLPRQAVTILKELRSLTGKRRHVFPGARDPKRCMSEAAVNAALARIGFKDEMVGHGFRHMASTRLEEMGWPDPVIEAQLSHKVGGVKGKYKRDQYLRFLPQRREMMQAWADYLDSLRAMDTSTAKRT